jgi:hypothetical protein
VNRLKLRVVIASVVAASVVLGAVVCAAFDLAFVSAALSIYALGAGAWLYHSIERYVVANRLDTVIAANGLNPVRPLARPLLPVMAAIIGLTQAVVRALSDVSDLQPQRRQVPVWRALQISRVNGRTRGDDEKP